MNKYLAPIDFFPGIEISRSPCREYAMACKIIEGKKYCITTPLSQRETIYCPFCKTKNTSSQRTIKTPVFRWGWCEHYECKECGQQYTDNELLKANIEKSKKDERDNESRMYELAMKIQKYDVAQDTCAK